MSQVKAKNLILDLMSVSGENAWPVKGLVRVAGLFDISENAIRVNLTRLLQKQLLIKDDRGHYKLSQQSSSLRAFVDSWRNASLRTRLWHERWLLLNINHKPQSKTVQAEFKRAANWLGFCEVHQGLWVRPDNLNQTHSQIQQIFSKLYQHGPVILSISEELPINEQFSHFQSYWDTDTLLVRYQNYIKNLKLSLARLGQIDKNQALVESFILGGDVIHFLALDPLLPDKMFPEFYRLELTELMKNYDQQARSVWNHFIAEAQLEQAPGHLEQKLLLA